MWGIISTAFLGIYCLMSYYIGRRGWTVLGKYFSPVYRKVFWLFLGVLVFSFPVTHRHRTKYKGLEIYLIR